MVEKILVTAHHDEEQVQEIVAHDADEVIPPTISHKEHPDVGRLNNTMVKFY